MIYGILIDTGSKQFAFAKVCSFWLPFLSKSVFSDGALSTCFRPLRKSFLAANQKSQIYCFVQSLPNNIKISGWTMKTVECSLCVSDNPETRLMFARLRTKIIRQSNVYEPQSQGDCKEDSPDGFSRLLALMFGHKATTSQPSFLHCPHSKLSRYFRRKLKCDNVTFNSLCSEVASKIAEKNYQLDALCTQVGSLRHTAALEVTDPMAEGVARRVLQEKERRDERKRMEATRNVLPAAEMFGQRSGMGVNWGMTHPPLMHFPWMFQGSHESN